MPPGAYIDSQDAWGGVDTAAGHLNQGCSRGWGWGDEKGGVEEEMWV